MTNIHLAIAGLLSSNEEVEEMKFISKVFMISIRIHELTKEAKQKHEQMTEKVTK
jgi:hypothetical protein